MAIVLQKDWRRRFYRVPSTVKIEKESRAGRTTVRLIGHFHTEHIGVLRKQLRNSDPCVLDLSEVTLVDVDVVRFLIGCEARGIEITCCSNYIREWMAREREG